MVHTLQPQELGQTYMGWILRKNGNLLHDQDDEQITELNTVDVDTQIHESHHNSNQIPEPSTVDETNLRSETEGIVDGGVGLFEREQGEV